MWVWHALLEPDANEKVHRDTRACKMAFTMSDHDPTTQNCLKSTQAMIEFLVRHKMSYWADQFEQIAKALQVPDAEKAVALQKKIPTENVEHLFDSTASKDHRPSADDAALLAKLSDDVTQAFAKLRSSVKNRSKKTNAAKTGTHGLNRSGGGFGATTRSQGGAAAPRRSNTD